VRCAVNWSALDRKLSGRLLRPERVGGGRLTPVGALGKNRVLHVVVGCAPVTPVDGVDDLVESFCRGIWKRCGTWDWHMSA
jgi:hypothetical protein